MAYQAQARPKRKPVSNPLQTATRKTNAKGQTRCHTRSSASLGEHEPGNAEVTRGDFIKPMLRTSATI
nr:hypothetical protein Iba_chr11cCG13340 [Ipomoea batatas]GMD57365.1 hypothetical protein Iba_chr11eCG12060 [Ipomoea batatas]GME13809.1 hypothetical protein Iba_scaffold14722CG0010 [Ipomoea batatas]